MPHPFVPRLLPLGDAAWTVELGDAIDEASHQRVLGLLQLVEHARMEDPQLAHVVDLVPGFCSLTVHFDPWQADAHGLGETLLKLALTGPRGSSSGRHWALPVCFDEAFALDLSRVSEARGLTPPALIEQLLAARFHVYMIGFQPGFPYMGGVPPTLATPRLEAPRQKVPAQSVAIAGQLCGVYPWDSPGGWNLLGRTPVRLFDPRRVEQPAMLAAGDTVQWNAVDRNTYDALEKAIGQGLPRSHFLVELPP